MVASSYCTNEAVNSLLNYSKYVVDSIIAEIDVPSKIKNICHLIFAGMVSYYGFEHINEIIVAFKNKIVYTNESINEYLSKMDNISNSTYNKGNKEDTYALFFQEYFYNKCSKKYFSKGQIIVSGDNIYEPDKLMECMIHEINHAVNSVDDHIIPRGDKFISRNGIYLSDYNTGQKQNRILEESINVLQTAEIMDHILEFGYYEIRDKELKYLLDSMDYAKGKKREGIGYYLTTPVVRPLYENIHLNKIIKEGRISGKVITIKNEIEEKTSVGSFRTLADALDDIYSFESNEKIIKTKSNLGNSIVRQYIRG